MAGRGRGRGRGSFSLETGALGFGRGEALPSAILQPPQLYPPLEYKSSPLSNTEVDEYLLALKQEFRAGMEDSHYFVKNNIKANDITRYSDKYKTNQTVNVEFKIDNCLLPKELHVKVKMRKVKAPTIITKGKRRRIETDSTDGSTVEVLEKVLEEKVIDDDEEVKEGDEVEEEEEYYEEDEEEENDYLVNHYDEGEDDFGVGDDDDADEGPVY